LKSDNELFIFIHIPKCGGTTLRENILLNYYANEVLCIYKAYNPEFSKPIGIENFISSLSEERKNEIKIIIGHNVYYGIHKLFPNKIPKYITFVRNPARRIVSLYNWMRTNREIGNDSVDSSRLMHNGEIIQFGMPWFELNKKTLQNGISKFLFHRFFYKKNLEEDISKDQFENVINTLEKFYFIGINENKDDMYFIYHILRLKKFHKSSYISLQYADPALIGGTLKKIEKNNNLDMRLYDYALKRNAEFKENYPNFENEIKESQLQRSRYFKSLPYYFSKISKYVAISNSQKVNQIKEVVSKFLISKRKYKWIFLVGCYNSGTTLLSRILEQHPQIAGLPDEGQFLTKELVTPREVDVPRLWAEKEKIFVIADNEKEKAKIVRRDWQKNASKVKAKYVLEKSPPNIVRMLWLQKNFPNAHFIHIVRNGYAVSLGIEEKVRNLYGYRDNLLGKAANQWGRSCEVFQRDMTKLNKVLEISYEELSEDLQKTLIKITDFLQLFPFEQSVFDKNFAIHGLNDKINNKNPDKLRRMTAEQKDIIESKVGRILKYYGYKK